MDEFKYLRVMIIADGGRREEVAHRALEGRNNKVVEIKYDIRRNKKGVV